MENKKEMTPFVAMLSIAIAICTLGFILTITIIGAVIGIPLLMLGAVLFIVVIFVKVAYMVYTATRRAYGL